MKKKKKSRSFVTFIEIVLVIYTYSIYHFTNTRMGMMRYVMFKNGQWLSSYPINNIFKFLNVILVVIFVLSLCFIVKRKNKLRSLLLLFFSLYTLSFINFHDVQNTISYYFVSIGLVVLVIVQLLYSLLKK